MTTGLWLLLYGAALAWLSPSLLRRLTKPGVSPQMGVAVWLTAISTTLITWVIAIVLIGLAAIDGLIGTSAATVCLELFGLSEHGGLAGLSGSIALASGGIAMVVIFSARTCRWSSRLRSRSREHADAVLMVGRPTTRPGVVVVEAQRSAAYCVSGHRPAIVVTSAAWSSLARSELAAVLTHEQAHIAGRHHQILTMLRAMAGALPRLPLMQQSSEAVAELLEMCADDAAARRHGVEPILGGLLAMAEPPNPVPAEGLAAAGTAVAVRAMRLAHPVRRTAGWCQRMLLALSMTMMLGTPAFISFLCHH
ncbi:M48 family metalloprotease [Mycobacterium barrassiae]|jgi:Zn-dependent protease with chaperone function|uniref:M56 family metallopeptidase n=1 Tax=Mycobacterium barrassiae TaxID=319709 RepID=UPI002265822D|nr:M56 family metallopeptidase [Mycobacterium barrassiae]MCV7303521.1 M48 family metalloprotease [Mycobacterium barrassiae]